MKKRVSVTLLIIFSLLFTAVFCVFGDTTDAEKCRRFLAQYGWETQTALHDKARITIPQEFDKVYENYNEMQKKSGFDLTPYRGKSGTRYTFIVTNYPADVGETVYANVIIINSTPVGGDIMTVSLDGFMHGLAENTP